MHVRAKCLQMKEPERVLSLTRPLPFPGMLALFQVSSDLGFVPSLTPLDTVATNIYIDRRLLSLLPPAFPGRAQAAPAPEAPEGAALVPSSQ